MKRFLFLRASPITVSAAGLCLALLCSCASNPAMQMADEPILPVVPGEVSFNDGAGRGDCLYVTLRLESGEKLLFGVDTGSPVTVLDKSLEPRLGARLKTRSIRFDYYGNQNHEMGGYRPPKLYLGDAPLVFSNSVTGDLIWTDDLSMLDSGRPVMGILGMDCLSRYCLQLDFEAKKLRLLDPTTATPENWGNVMPLAMPRTALVLGTLLGQTNELSIIDTGDTRDGAIMPKLLRHELMERKMTVTNIWKAPNGTMHREAAFPEVVFGGQSYRDLELGDYMGNSEMVSRIGLRFLARNLVTINFPKGEMYLKRTSETVPVLKADILGTGTLGWWAVGSPGLHEQAVKSLAEAITDAPNLRVSGKVDANWFGFYQLPVKRMRIAVTAPEATLSAVELPPGNYHLNISSKAEMGPDGIMRGTTVFNPENHSSMVPFKEKGTVIVLHDYNRQKEFMCMWGFLLAQAGYRVVLVDLRGHGESTGQTISYGKYETADLMQMLDFLNKQGVGKGRVGVLGVGYGAQLALQWAAHDPRVGAVVAMAPFGNLEKTFTGMAKSMKVPVAPETLQQALDAAAARLDIKWADWSGEAATHQLKQPVFYIGAEKDAWVTPDDIKNLEQASPPGSKTLSVPGARHENLPLWFHVIGEPVKAWFQEHPNG